MARRSGQRHAGNIDLLTRLGTSLNAVGVTLPEDFVEFYSWDGWADELDRGSVTGCWTSLGPLPTFSPVEPGAFLVRFLSDQQDCVVWYLYLRQGEPACVVHAFDLESDYGHDQESGVIYQCASTFEEFAYRFWAENRIWHHLHDSNPGELPPRFASYLAHYPQPSAPNPAL
ncbi:hypothetical protein [Micromonospora sp. NBC_01412]|uniref:hypothetical protein n=1 Tax=Micromonospora sp. NBC_01412 TaxID=2903590 RepID=UPI0032488FBB